MASIEIEREADAPAGAVWRVMTDIARAPEVLSGVDAVERLDGGGDFGVGTRWRETRTLMGRQATEELEVTAVDPGRSYTVEAESGGAHYVSVMAVEPLGSDRSRLSMTFGARPASVMGRVMAATIGRLFVGATRKALATDLDELAAAAERGA